MPSPTILTGLIVGAVLGFILQRGRFCITGAFRDLWVSRSWRWFTAFLLAIAVQAVGVAVLTGTGSITPEIPRLSVVATRRRILPLRSRDRPGRRLRHWYLLPRR